MRHCLESWRTLVLVFKCVGWRLGRGRCRVCKRWPAPAACWDHHQHQLSRCTIYVFLRFLYMLSEMRVHYCASLLTNPWHCFVRGVWIVSLDVWLKCAHVLWIFFLKSKLLLDIVVIHLLCVDCLISFFVPSGLDRMRRWKNASGAIVHAWHSQSWATHMFRVGEALSTNSAREFKSA